MEELYIERFFKEKEELVDKEIIKSPDKLNSTSESIDRLSQMFLFLRLLKEDCEKLFKKAPFLSRALFKLEESIYSNKYAEALLLMDELEELLDLVQVIS